MRTKPDAARHGTLAVLKGNLNLGKVTVKLSPYRIPRIERICQGTFPISAESLSSRVEGLGMNSGRFGSPT